MVTNRSCLVAQPTPLRNRRQLSTTPRLFVFSMSLTNPDNMNVAYLHS